MAEFSGVPTAGLDMLAALPTRDKRWMAANKKDYTALIADPAKAFVSAMIHPLRDRISPGLVGQPKTNGSISPINNDLRFSPGADPYKDHLLVKFWDGPHKKVAPTLWVLVGRDDVGFASGMSWDKSALDRWRAAIDGRAGEELAAAIAVLPDADVAGEGWKRVPAPYPADHPRAQLLRHAGLQVRWPEPSPVSITDASFVDWCVERLSKVAPIHHWLVKNMG